MCIRDRYRALLKNIELAEVFAKSEVSVWECRNCGHIVVGTNAPEVCPACAHPQSYFCLLYTSALDDVSLSVEEGEFLAIVGTSGSGKTTLLNLLGGLDIPTEGGVWIEGQSLRDMNNEERTVFRRKYIGFVFQQYNLVPILNIYENIVLPLRLDSAKIDDELLEEIVKFLGIKEKLGNLPKELSGGQQQRVAIARALLALSLIHI